MYSSRGSNAYGQQSYGAQSAFGQNLGSGYSGSSVGGPDGSSQISIASRHSALLGSSQDAEINAYRGHPSSAAHYGGQYSSVYGSAALSSGQQVPAMSAKGSGTSALEGRSGYASAIPDSPKYTSGDYLSSSSLGYGHKSDQLFSEKIPDYPSIDRRQYGERQSAYLGRDLQSEPTGRYADSAGFGHQHQPERYDRLDQASLLRQEQILKAQSLQAASLDGGARQADYLAARGATIRNSTQDLLSYGGRMDADPRSLSMLSGSSYSGQPAPSILGAAPRRNVEDLMYAQSSSNPGYGVSLPPGRDYATGKGLHSKSLESDYPNNILSRGHPRIDELKDDRGKYVRDLELRDEERRREHLRDREKEREREREKERQREREREREREKERERERIMERRDRERERERKRGLEKRRERSPARISRERRDASLIKEGRSSRHESPRREALHRRHSPVKEKRRDYICKVYSFSLVDVERDYLSIDKRYPRLFTSPEFSKVVVNWPRENLKLSIHTPVSFEHDFVEESMAEQKEPTVKMAEEPLKSKEGSTVWNAKMILMSGLSRKALEDLSSEKSFDDRIPHICNILRFAILKKDHSFMAIGGPCDTVGGVDPSADDSLLVQSVLRYAKDVTQLDLQNCRHWNRFLEIHYDRVGKDGLFSHKEVTVLFVPDLSECLPSLDAWRDQWLAHKKAIAERERQLLLKKEKSREKKEVSKGKDIGSSKDIKSAEKSPKKKEFVTSEQTTDNKKNANNGNEVKGSGADREGGDKDKKGEKKNGVEMVDEGANIEKKKQGELAVSQAVGGTKPGKKKIIKKIVKQKVSDKKGGVSSTAEKQNDQLDEKDAPEHKSKSETSGQEKESSANPTSVKTFIRRKVAKKVPVVKKVENDEEGTQPMVKTEMKVECSDDKPQIDLETTSAAVGRTPGVKTTIKRKVIKRVPKKKAAGSEASGGVAVYKVVPENDGEQDQNKVVLQENKEKTGEQTVVADNLVNEVVKLEKNKISKTKSKAMTTEKQDIVANSSKIEVNAEKKDDKGAEEKSGFGTKIDTEAVIEKDSQKDNHNNKKANAKGREKSKVEMEKKDTDGKSNKEIKENRKPEEPPRPGFILQTKWNKDSKLRSLSLSLDSLLDYTDKDLEESSFELSLFAETLYEMLQYQMGCRVLGFLQKLRIKFVTKRNQRKRPRDDISDKEKDKIGSSTKRPKTNELPVKNISTKSGTPDAAHQDDGKTVAKDASVDGDENAKHEEGIDGTVDGDEKAELVDGMGGAGDCDEKVKLEDEMDYDEDPEEDPEEDEEMQDGSPPHKSSNENIDEDAKADADSEAKIVVEKKDETEESSKKRSNEKTPDTKPKTDVDTGKENETNAQTQKKETPVVKEVALDKELLQAFMFFDRNRVGYIRVEDMRLILHSLHYYLSHRDVKELVQSALLESNTGRDDRILYKKLLRMTDL